MTQFKHMYSKERKGDTGIQLIPALRRLYNSTPLPFRSIVSPWLFRLYGYYRLFLDLKLRLWIAAGNDSTTQMPLSILCAAMDDKDHNLNYLLNLAFGASFRKQDLGRVWLWKIPKVIAEKGMDCPLTIIQIRKRYLKLLKSSGWVYIPNWLIGEVDIPSDPAITKDSSLKSDLRRIRKNSLRFEVTRAPQDFDDFYHNMYVPYITMAHSSSAYIIPYISMKPKFKHCDLLLVMKQEERIGGILIAYEKSGPRLWSLGIRDANPEYLKDGAVGALFYFSLCHLKNKGFTKASFGQSRAFLRDGVLKYKGKWSQRVVGSYREGFALKVLSYTSAARAFLENNPFIFENNGCLIGAVFVDTGKPLTSKEIKKIYKEYFHLGLSKICIYHLQHNSLVEQESVPAELSEHIVFRAADEITRGV